MTTNRLKHIEPSSTVPTGSDTLKARALENPSADQSALEIKTFYVNLDKWVRHRIRACYWKQWRKAGARTRNLMKLGLSREDAVSLASSSRGPWFMSKCRSIERALTNDYLAESGLVSLYEIWQKTRS
jgi:hypothetical protein